MNTTMAAARGILLKCGPTTLAVFGGPVQLNRHWARSLLHRMKFVQRKLPQPRVSKVGLILQQQRSVHTIVVMEKIPAELILNWDQTGINFVPCCTWTMERQGTKRVEVIRISDKRQVTAVLCGSLSGDFLPVQLIYKGKISRCHPRFAFPSGWYFTHSPNHWSTQETMIQLSMWNTLLRLTLRKFEKCLMITSQLLSSWTISRGKSQSPLSVFLMPTTSILAF